MPPVRALVYGDLHLGPTDPERSHERPDFDDLEVDVVLSVGDVIDDNTDHAGQTAGQPYEDRGRAFFEYLDETADVPVVVVPGNHDPAECTARLIEGLPSVVSVHHRSVSGETLVDAGQETLGGLNFVGIGAEQFDLTRLSPGIDLRKVATVDHSEWPSDFHTIQETVRRLTSVVGQYLAGRRSRTAVADALEVDERARQRFFEQLDHIETDHERFVRLITGAPSPAVVLSHMSPFDVNFDKYDDRNPPWDQVPRGSLALRMAVAKADPFVLISGHTHQRGQDVVETVGGHAHLYNSGGGGPVVVEMDPERDLLVPDVTEV